jgi:hypothetical protein
MSLSQNKISRLIIQEEGVVQKNVLQSCAWLGMIESFDWSEVKPFVIMQLGCCVVSPDYSQIMNVYAHQIS